MIRVLFFGSVRARLGVEALELSTAEAGDTAQDLRHRLAARGGAWAEVLDEDARVLVAINQQLTGAQSSIEDGDEIAFMPPVTGG